MKRSQRLISSLFCSVLAVGCTDNAADNKTTTNPGASQSGSETSAGNSSTTDVTTDSGDPTVATATTTAPATATDTGATTEVCTFLNCSDAGDKGECDNWAQDCPEGQKCSAWIGNGGSTWDAVHCVEIIGEGKTGDECTSEGAISGRDSCEKGAMCWGVNMDGIGTCVALCTGTEDAPVCAGEGTCTIANEGSLNLCLTQCDPLVQDCLTSGEVCYPISDTFTCAPDASGEEGQANDACEYINVCDKGLMCGDAAFVGGGCDAAASGCCTPFCEFPGGACPNPDQSCVQYFDPADLPFPNAGDIGVCGIPT